MLKLKCEHSFCKDCLKDYCKAMLGQNNLNLSCFHKDEETNLICNRKMSEDDINLILDEEMRGKLAYLEKFEENADTRECPYCHHLNDGTRKHPEMKCVKCNATFCFFHSNAHQNKSCNEYER